MFFFPNQSTYLLMCLRQAHHDRPILIASLFRRYHLFRPIHLKHPDFRNQLESFRDPLIWPDSLNDPIFALECRRNRVSFGYGHDPDPMHRRCLSHCCVDGQWEIVVQTQIRRLPNHYYCWPDDGAVKTER